MTSFSFVVKRSSISLQNLIGQFLDRLFRLFQHVFSHEIVGFLFARESHCSCGALRGRQS